MSLEEEPAFQAAVSKVKTCNDAILKPLRQADLAKQYVTEAAAKQQRQEREAELYRSSQS